MGRSKEEKKATELLTAVPFASQKHSCLGCRLPKTSDWSQAHAEGCMTQGQALHSTRASFCTPLCQAAFCKRLRSALWA